MTRDVAVVYYAIFGAAAVVLSFALRAAALDAGYRIPPVHVWQRVMLALLWPIALVYLIVRGLRAARRTYR